MVSLRDQPALSWLYAETTVVAARSFAGKDNLLMVETWMNPPAAGKFAKRFPGHVVRDL